MLTMEMTNHSPHIADPNNETAANPMDSMIVDEGVSRAVAELQTEIQNYTRQSIQANIETADGQFPKLFFTKTIEEANQVIGNYELKTNAKFVVYKESKYFGQNRPLHFMACKKEGNEYRVNHRISWEDRETSLALYNHIPYDEVPFMLLGRKICDCHLGVLRDKPKRDHTKKPRKSQGSRKVGCTARVTLREIHKFPEFKLEKGSDSDYYRALKSVEIRKAILDREDIGERRIYVSLPSVSDHSGHDMTRVDNFLTDPRVKRKIYELTYQNVSSIKDLRDKTREYVEKELFQGLDLPSRTDTRFHPSDMTFKNISYLARVKMRKEGLHPPTSGKHQGSKRPNCAANVPKVGQEVTVGSSTPPSPAVSVEPPEDFFAILEEIQNLADKVEEKDLLETLKDNLLVVHERLKEEVGSTRQRLEHDNTNLDSLDTEQQDMTSICGV